MSANKTTSDGAAQAAGSATDGPSGLLDPRGIPAEAPVRPAPRLAAADGRRMLLLDNGKLAPGNGPNPALPDALQAAIPAATWLLERLDLLKAGDSEVEAIAARLIATHRPDAVVLALADAGVTAHTALLAVALENCGTPAVVLATPLGAGLARTIFRTRAPGLDAVVLDTVRTDTEDRLRGIVTAAVPAILSLLTREAPAAAAAGQALFPPDAARRWAGGAADMAAFQDWADQAGLGDGLPLIPPTAEAVAALLATVDADADAVLYGPALTSGRLLRVHDAAANAVMAGCPPRGFPVVLAALRAMARPDYRLTQAAITTHPSGNAIVLAGGDPTAYGMSAGAGCLGPGHRGNACIGRAVSLAILHLFGARPGEADLTTFGSPAEFTYCMAEAHDSNPWPSLATEFGDGRPGVLVVKAEGPRNILENLALTPEALCEALAATSCSLGANNMCVPGDLLVFLNPEHAAVFTAAGWTRQDLAHAIHDRARLPRRLITGRGIGPIRPRYMDALDRLPVTRSPADVHIVVAGAPGPQSMVALPWGFSRGQWQAL
jgi:hypothetical protein